MPDQQPTIVDATIDANEQKDDAFNDASISLNDPKVKFTPYDINNLSEYVDNNGLDALISLVENSTGDEPIEVQLHEGPNKYSKAELQSFIEFEKGAKVTPPEVVSGTELKNKYSVITPDITNSNAFKIIDEGQFQEIEIRPALRRLPDEIPFFLRMVDSDLKNAAFYMAPGILVTGIILSPNPDTFSISSTKIINRYHSMTRWIEEYWGDEMDTVTFSGSTFSFFGYQLVGAPNVGLTTEYSRDSMAYKWLREFVKIMEYNGLIFQDNITYQEGLSGTGFTDLFLNDEKEASFRTNHPLKGTVRERLYMNMYYDYVSFLGHFESFDVMETSNIPYRYTYNSIFKVERTKYYRTKY